ncbi:hypothetical protein ABIF97_002549 [Bradyrhizobium japonicum]
MTNLRVAPIDYDERSAEALNVCLTYLEQAEAYVQGDRDTPPDPTPLLSARFPSSKLLAATLERAVDGIKWPTISVLIEDSEAKNPRHFDPWYFVTMLLLELPGGRIVLDRSKMGEYFYAAYAGSNKRQNINLHRMIANTPIWGDTKHSDDAHHDCRRIRLFWVCKNLIRKRGQKTRAVSKGREDVIRFALGIFERELARQHGTQLDDASTLPSTDLTLVDYEMLLRVSLHLADSVHEKYLLQSRNASSEPS